MSIYIIIGIAYIIGILASTYIGLYNVVLFCICVLFCAVICKYFFHKRIKTMCIIIIFLMIGTIQFEMMSNIEYTDSIDYLDKYVTLRGKISELPTEYEGNYSYVLDVRELTYDDNTIKNSDKIKVTSETKYEFGDTIVAEGFLLAIKEKMNTTSFDSVMYYKNKGIFYHLHSKNDREWGTKYTPLTVRNFVNTGRSKLSNLIDTYYEGTANALLKAIFLGSLDGFEDDYEDTLQKTGVRRILYTPFVHIFCISLMLGWVCTKFSLNKQRRDIILVVILILYVLLNGTKPIYIKAPLLLVFLLYRRNVHGFVYKLDLLASTILIILFLEPLSLYDTGLILSSVSTILIYMFSKHMYYYLRWIPHQGLRGMVSVWLICTIGLMPICAYFFAGSTIYMILCMLIVAPFVVALLFLSPIVFIMLVLFKTAPILGGVQSFLLWILAKLPMLIEKIPFFYTQLKPMQNIQLLFFYMVLVIIKFKMIHKDKTFTAQLLKTSATTMLVMICINTVSQFGVMEMMFVNVGQGDAAVINIPYRDTILIDGGGGPVYSDYNVGKYVYLPYLQKAGLFRADLAVVTHYHKDHCEGMVEAMRNMKIKMLLMPDCDPENEYRIVLENEAKKQGTKIIYVNNKFTISYRSGLKVNILHPDTDGLSSSDPNDTSIVTEIEYGEFKALFTGDITDYTEKKLLDENILDEYDVVKVPHHGSAGSNSEEFVDKIDAKYAVFCVGEDNTYGLPAPAVVERYAANQSQTLRTDMRGDIRFYISKKGIKNINTYKE